MARFLEHLCNTAIRQLRISFVYFLKLSFLKRFFITYVGCWSGFLFMFLFSKILALFTTKKAVVVAKTVASKKFEVVSHAVSSTVSNTGPTYFSVALSYFINNLSACILIIMTFPLVAYIYKKEVSTNKNSINEYLNSIMLFYLIIMLNPLTGIVGYNIDVKDIVAILPHGVFEFAGFSLSIITGVILAEKILPIDRYYDKSPINETKHKNKNKKEYKKIVLCIICVAVLIGIAASLEPIDWVIYDYAKSNNLNLLCTEIMAYKNIIYYLFYHIL